MGGENGRIAMPPNIRLVISFSCNSSDHLLCRSTDIRRYNFFHRVVVAVQRMSDVAAHVLVGGPLAGMCARASLLLQYPRK